MCIMFQLLPLLLLVAGILGAFVSIATLENADFHLVGCVASRISTTDAMAWLQLSAIYCELLQRTKKNGWSIYSANFYAATIGMMCFYSIYPEHAMCPRLSTVLLQNKQFCLFNGFDFVTFFPYYCALRRASMGKIMVVQSHMVLWVVFAVCTTLFVYVCVTRNYSDEVMPCSFW